MLRKMVTKIWRGLIALLEGRAFTLNTFLKKNQTRLPETLSSLRSFNLISFFLKPTPCYINPSRDNQRRQTTCIQTCNYLRRSYLKYGGRRCD